MVFKTREFLYSIFLAFIFILLKGYQFNTGDHCEHLPQIYQLFDHELYAGDFFITYYQKTFTVRAFFIMTIYSLSYIFKIEWTCFFLLIGSISMTVAAWMKISFSIHANLKAAYLSPILILFIFYNFTVGGNMITYNMLTCSTLAKAISSWALYFYLTFKYNKSFLLLGVATLFQVLVGLQLSILLGILLCLNYQKIGFGAILKAGFIYMLVASFMILPLLTHQFSNIEIYDVKLFEQIMYKIRAPHHFIPSSFPKINNILFLALILTTVVFLKKPKNIEKSTILIQFAIIQLIITGIYIISIDFLNNYELAKLQWFKTTIWVVAFCSVIIADKATTFDLKEIKLIKYSNHILLTGSLVLLFIITNSRLLPLDKLKKRYLIGNYQKSNLTKIHQWISENTPKNALFFTFPLDISFSCEAKRPTLVSQYAMVHEPKFTLDWYQTMNYFYGINFENCKNKHYLQVANENYSNNFLNLNRSDIVYRLDNLDQIKYKDSLGTMIHQEGEYVLTAIDR